MTVRVSKPKFNLREKLSELDKPTGVKGNALMRSETSQEARDLISSGRKNKIINGAMLIDQRHNGSSHTSSNNYHTDRFRTQTAGMDQLNQSYQRVSDGPDGFPRSLKITTNTAESDVASSGEYISLYQKIEGQNLQDLAYGTAGAKPVTISFYVKSSITGTFGYDINAIKNHIFIIIMLFILGNTLISLAEFSGKDIELFILFRPMIVLTPCQLLTELLAQPFVP